MKTATNEVNFHNLEIAFRGKSDADLTRAYWLFKALSSNFLVKNGPRFLDLALGLRLPVLPVVKATIYQHFCGGEDIHDCEKTIQDLKKNEIGSVLDYSVEGEENDSDFEQTTNEIILTIDRAKGDFYVPFCVFKVTGIAPMQLLEKVSAKIQLSEKENAEYVKIKERCNRICKRASENNVRVFIDAEDSWIQNAIDELAEEMMEQYNGNAAIVYNTIQLYRTDRVDYLKNSHQHAKNKNYRAAYKLVRGAYMEKERRRALEKNYPSPIQPDQTATNNDYNAALKYCIEHRNEISFCAGTHNEESCQLLIQLMTQNNIPRKDPEIWFSQLLGMSDHISGNLAAAGYNVAKYVPYGPVKSVLPYLIRRAQENTSIAGQTGRELKMILEEKNRRNKRSK